LRNKSIIPLQEEKMKNWYNKIKNCSHQIILGSFLILLVVSSVQVINLLISANIEATSQVRYLREYYLTPTIHDGNEALSACASGYHMASFWEIYNTSVLKYNTTLGAVNGDSGEGPPDDWGWIRTGASSNVGTVQGSANCAAYTSDNPADNGTIVSLGARSATTGWTQSTSVEWVAPWLADIEACVGLNPVWCVENY
jgi:hypothetical protein